MTKRDIVAWTPIVGFLAEFINPYLSDSRHVWRYFAGGIYHSVCLAMALLILAK